MSLKSPQLTLTANGTLDFGSSPTENISYAVDGTFGGGSVEVGYISNSVFVKYADIQASTEATQGVVTCGSGRSVAFKLTGATAPSLYVSVNPA